MFKKTRKQKNNLKAGFTLIELLITMTIFVIITGVVLVNSNSFNGTELLNDFTYDVALTIKEAQTYAVNVQENISGSFITNYGVYFNKSGIGGNNTAFVLFDDINGDGKYTTSLGNNNITVCSVSDTECIQKYSLKNGIYITNICAGQDDASCNQSANQLSQLSILFQRPKLNALIYAYDLGGTLITQPAPTYAKITLSSAAGATSSVVVTGIGQIYIKNK